MEIKYKKRVEIKDLHGLIIKLKTILGDSQWVSTEEADLIAYGKDYQLITNTWMMEGFIPGKSHVICWPENEKQVAEILKLANKLKIPTIPYGEGSGVVGAAIPIYGGIMIDMKRMNKIIQINKKNLTATIQTGANGKKLERELEQQGYLIGHVPQSFHTSTLGGWIAHRAAGQFSTKYGKIEDILLSMRVVTPTGEIIDTKLYPRSSNGPQMERLWLSSEGTLGVVTQATIKVWPLPEKREGSAFVFENLSDALKATRRIMQRQVLPAVIRIYDKIETERHFPDERIAKNKIMVIFISEGTKEIVNFEINDIRKSCILFKGIDCDQSPIERWFKTRFDVKAASEYGPKGFIFDTVEVACMWDNAEKLYNGVVDKMKEVDGLLMITGHASHFYPNGLNFYFTFGGLPPEGESHYNFYKKCWSAVMEGTLENSGSISHHHGIGLVRAGWMKAEHGNMLEVLKKIKSVLDPNGIMNPGKLYEESESPSESE